MKTLLAIVAVMAAAPLWAATPASGTLTLDELSLEYTAGPFFNANVAHQADDGSNGPTCQPPLLECDEFALTLDFPEGLEQVYPSALVRIKWGWEDVSGSGLIDFDCWVYDGDGNLASTSGVGASNPEAASLLLYGGVSEYVLTCAPYLAAGESFTGTVEVSLGEPVEPLPEDDESGDSAGFASILVPQSDEQSADSRSAAMTSGSGSVLWFLPLLGLMACVRRRR